jgi:hypothetical protein
VIFEHEISGSRQVELSESSGNLLLYSTVNLPSSTPNLEDFSMARKFLAACLATVFVLGAVLPAAAAPRTVFGELFTSDG